MGIIVQKFGGSSVASTEKLWNVCHHIRREKDDGNWVIVVVSAQGKTTDHLIYEEAQITSSPRLKEHDFLVSVRRTNHSCKTLHVFTRIRNESCSLYRLASSYYYRRKVWGR